MGAPRLRCFFRGFGGALGTAFRLPDVPGGAGGVASSARMLPSKSSETFIRSRLIRRRRDAVVVVPGLVGGAGCLCRSLEPACRGVRTPCHPPLSYRRLTGGRHFRPRKSTSSILAISN